MRILIESSGSLVSNYLIKSIKDLGFEVVGSDVDDFNYSKISCDDFFMEFLSVIYMIMYCIKRLHMSKCFLNF